MNAMLDYFGKHLMLEVRDRTIALSDKRLTGLINDERFIAMSKHIGELNEDSRSILMALVPQITDLCIHFMLCFLEDDPNIHVIVNDVDIAIESDGMAGELYTEDGWICKYSKERTDNWC